MKELSTGEKAKRYDEAVCKLRGMMPNWERLSYNGKTFLQDLTHIFPELAESEDEKIRESLLEYLHTLPNHYAHSGVCAPEWIAWVEKQNLIMAKSPQLGEQKPYGQMEKCVNCQFNYAGECKGSCTMKRGEQKPAEDVDLPEFESYLCLMFQKFRTKGMCTNGEIFDFVNEHSQKLKDTLCHAWSKEDEENFKHLMNEIVCLGNSRNSANRLYYDRLIKFIEELKNRVQPKEKWCNKDERMLDRLIAYFEKQVAFTNDDNPRYANWLKSLRPQSQWKPSDEQMETLKFACGGNYVDLGVLESLYQDLKKLKEK